MGKRTVSRGFNSVRNCDLVCGVNRRIEKAGTFTVPAELFVGLTGFEPATPTPPV